MTMRAATRGSALARWQTQHVGALLADRGGDGVEEVIVSTLGDRDKTTPLHAIGGKGVFVKEVQAAVLDGRADLAVHSGKDLPAETPDGLVLVAVPERADARDALVGCRWDDLSAGAHVATGSVRRRAQMAWLRPDLRFSELRGNVPTRMEKAADFDAIVVAAAAIDRLGLSAPVIDRLDPSVMVPQVAQGALAVECRVDDHATIEVVRAIDHPDTRRAVDAERAFLSELGGDCDLPAGAHGVLVGDEIELVGMLASLDGRVLIRERRRGGDPESLGRAVARFLLDDAGGTDLLSDAR
jgi:hydroxymethylbilane synthase